jgi:hypothetical protein
LRQTQRANCAFENPCFILALFKATCSPLPIAHNQVHRSGPQRIEKFAAVALEVEFPCEFESIFETALDYESDDQLGTYGEIILDKIISLCCRFKVKHEAEIKGRL